MTNRPNIVLILFDSLSPSDLATHAETLPNLRKLQAQSLSFGAALAPCPQAGPARASLFTGLDVAAHGVWTDGVALPPHETPFPERFTAAGYTTWLVGRRQLAGASHWTTEHTRPGEYAYVDWAHGPLHRSRQNAYLSWLEDTAPERYAAIFPRQPNADDTDIPAEQRAAMDALPDALSFNHWVCGQALTRMAEAEGPFLGILGFVTGDSKGGPAPTPERVDPKALALADQGLGKILRAVDAMPNTYAILTAARGTATHPGQPPLHRDALHVPLFLLRDDDAPSRVAGIVSTIDLAPTLLDIAHVPAPARLQGRSLLTSAPRGWSLARLRSPEGALQTALTTVRWKLVMTHGAEADCLFDLIHDPQEAENLALDPAHQDTLDEMYDQMIDARVALEDRTEPRIALF